MTTLLLVLVSLPSPLSPMYLDQAKGGAIGIDVDTQTLFYAPLSTNGMEAAAPSTGWPAALTALGVPATTGVWWGDDPTGAAGKSTTTFTQTNSTTEVDTPFCPDGSWSSLATGCLKARRFTGSQYYTATEATSFRIGSADASVCILYRAPDDTISASLVSTREGAGNGEGWNFQLHSGGSSGYFMVENHAGTQVAATFNDFDIQTRSWMLLCGTHDYDGNQSVIANAQVDSITASPGGTIASTTALQVGARGDGGATFTGDIAAVLFWNSLLTAANIADLFEYFAGITDTKGAPVAFTNTGPNCCWVDGAIECFGDDWPMLGCELPPGVTGAGSPSSGFLSMPALTNSVLYSIDLDSWADAGTPTPTATSTDLFRDGRQTYRITDNDAGAKESVYQNLVHGLSNGDKVQICVYAKDSTGTSLDLLTTEYNGVCSGGATAYTHAAKTITTSWAQYEWTHTITDQTCTTFRINLCIDCDANAPTGSAEFVAQVFLDQDWCPPIYIETAAAAVGAGDDALIYSIGGTGIVDGSGNIVGAQTWTVNVTPMAAAFADSSGILDMSDNSSSDRAYLYINTSEQVGVYHTSGGAGATNYMTSAVLGWTPGTGYALKVDFDFGADTYELFRDDVSLDTDATAKTSPTGLTTLDVGVEYREDRQWLNGWIEEVRITR